MESCKCSSLKFCPYFAMLLLITWSWMLRGDTLLKWFNSLLFHSTGKLPITKININLHQVFFLSMFMKLNIKLSGCHYCLCNIYIGSWVWWEYRAVTIPMNMPLAMVNFGGLCYLIGNIKLIKYMKIACFQSLHVVKDHKLSASLCFNS